MSEAFNYMKEVEIVNNLITDINKLKTVHNIINDDIDKLNERIDKNLHTVSKYQNGFSAIMDMYTALVKNTLS